MLISEASDNSEDIDAYFFLSFLFATFLYSTALHVGMLKTFLNCREGALWKKNGKQRFGKNSKKSPSHRPQAYLFQNPPLPSFVLAARAHVISRYLRTHCFYPFISLTMNMTLHYFSLSGCPHADRCSLQAQHQDLK